jgi:hypothetical protein
MYIHISLSGPSIFVAIKSGNAEANDLTLCYGKIDHRIFDVPTKK